MSDTKRYQTCEACKGNTIKTRVLDRDALVRCAFCGHGECAPGVVDAGVPWQSEAPTSGRWWLWHPEFMRQPTWADIISEGAGLGWRLIKRHDLLDGRWRFAPYTIPAPPKE